MVGMIGEKVFRLFQEGEGEAGVKKAGEDEECKERWERQERGNKVWRKGKEGMGAVKLRRKGKECKWERKRR